MPFAIHRKLTVLDGGKIELIEPHLATGQAVDVFVVISETEASTRPSALDILNQAPGHRLFQTAEEVDAFLRNERDAWDR